MPASHPLPTRLALSAHARGEAVPRTHAGARKLAAKGTRLLERYARSKGGSKASTPTRGKKATKRKRA